jgi:hypothetical protein
VTPAPGPYSRMLCFNLNGYNVAILRYDREQGYVSFKHWIPIEDIDIWPLVHIRAIEDELRFVMQLPRNG